MAKWLLVGDPHAVVDELDDCEALIKGVLETVRIERPDYVLFMGDQFHNHAIMHVEVMAFWRKAFKRLAGETQVLALVGNHDMPGDGSSMHHALQACEGSGVTVIDSARVVGGVGLIPYQPRPEFFPGLVRNLGTNTILCHQTFDGSKYENGFYAQDGVPLAGMEHVHFISGHIHTPQAFANVIYVGAPRWRTLSDVGVERALVLVDLTNPDPPKVLKLFDTGQWCQKLVHIEDRQDAPADPSILNPTWKYIVDIFGSQSFIQERKKLWVGCRIRTFKTQEKGSVVRESMGIDKALQTYLAGYRPRFGTSMERLAEMVAERVW